MSGRHWFGRGWLFVVYLFLYLPIVSLVLYSFNDGAVPNLWRGFTLRWYRALADDRELLGGLWLSLRIAFCTACASVVLGTLAASALVRYRRFAGRTLFAGMVSAPLVMPEVVIGLSLLLMLVAVQGATQQAFGIAFPERGLLTIWLGHLLLGLAYATVVIQARLQDLDPQLEEAAMDLGARPCQVFGLVTLPMIGQALLSAWLLTFTLSLDDVVLSAFLSGPGTTTLPLVIFSRARLGLNPSVNAVATLFIAVVGTGVVVASALLAHRERVRARETAAAARAAWNRVPWLAYLSLAASMALVGSYVGLSKFLVAVFPIFLLAWLRFGIAALAMAPWTRRPADEPPLGARDRKLLFLESFFGNFLFSVCMLFGIAASSALAAGVIMGGLPAAVALMSRLFLKERIAPRTLAGIACAVGGIVLVSFAKSDATTSGGSFTGNLLLVGALLCEASYVVIGKQLTGRVGPKRISALINLWGLALVTPFGLWQARGFDFGTVPAASWTLLLFYAVAASIVTVWLWMTGLTQVPASSAGVFTVVLPLSAAVVGVTFLGERFSTVQAAAYALALAGVVLATWPGRGLTRQAPAAPHPG